ncbi:MAG: peptidylprolyl isomerase [Clostridia bacterium]|nr:peptidylprolyl isomerase [Clostridia bacterium]
MKRFLKTACVLLSVLMLFAAFMTLAACEDLKTVNVKVSVYDASSEKMVEKTVKITLYRHLADDTVDAITDYINKGYYNDLVLYKNTESNTQQIMIGDLNYKNGQVVDYASSVSYVHAIAPEFNAAGVTGSDLKNTEGSIGLWRTWLANGSFSSNVDAAFNSGWSTLFMPTTDINSYNGYFTVFGKIELTDEETSEAVALVKNVLNSGKEGEQIAYYTVFYTGEYGNLVYNCMPSDEFDEQYASDEDFKNSVFAAEGEQFVSFNRRKIVVPVGDLGKGGDKVITAKIVSVTLA